jgi:hypothetical protein
MNRASIADSDRTFLSAADITDNCTGLEADPKRVDFKAPAAVEGQSRIVTCLQ